MPVQVEIARPAFVDSDTPNARQFNDVTVKTATVPDAAATTEGVVRLAGDLAGTADAPQLAVVSSLNAGEYGKTDLNVPSITVDAKGRVTKAEDRALQFRRTPPTRSTPRRLRLAGRLWDSPPPHSPRSFTNRSCNCITRLAKSSSRAVAEIQIHGWDSAPGLRTAAVA